MDNVIYLVIGVLLGWVTLPILKILKLLFAVLIVFLTMTLKSPQLKKVAELLVQKDLQGNKKPIERPGDFIGPTQPNELRAFVWCFPLEHEQKTQQSILTGKDFPVRTGLAFSVGSDLGYKAHPKELVNLQDRELESLKWACMNISAEIKILQDSRQGVNELLNSLGDPDET